MQQQYAEEQALLGKLCPGEKKLEGKTFYLDGVKKRSTALLLEAVSLLGGRVESFLHKDVSFVVTENQDGLKEQKCTDTRGRAKGMIEESQRPNKESILNSERQRPVTPRPVACGSRGKALLEKAIRNNERLQRSSVLTNARSWGVKILYVNDVLLYLKQLTRETFSAKHKRTEKTYTKQQGSIVKATALRSPYLKIEDSSRKYKPLHMQSMTFPSFWYSGRFSPFETPLPKSDKRKGQEKKIREKKEGSIQNKSETPLSCNPSPWRPRKKDLSYCECCHQHFTILEEHLQSDQHRTFVLDPSNYSVMDQLVVDMFPGFNPNPSQQSEETLNRPPTPLPIQELEPLSDVETERAIQALQRQGSSDLISSTTAGPVFFGPASPSPAGVQLSIPSPATPTADIQAVIDIQPHMSSPAMPVLDVEPQVHNSATQQPDNQDTLYPSCDPYLLAPVLSPQVPYSSYLMELHSPYSEPPVLSPQEFTAEEAVEGAVCDMDIVESLSESVPAVTDPICTPLFPSVAVTNARVKGSNQDSLLEFNGIVRSSNDLKCDKLVSHRSRSLSQQSSAATNPKKRCRSASPDHSQSKRSKITMGFGYSCKWTEQKHKSAKQEGYNMPNSEGCLLFDKDTCQTLQSFPSLKGFSMSSMCTADTAGSKRTTFCVPAVQNFTQAPFQIDILCHGSTSVADRPSKIFDPPLQFSNNKSHGVFSSQDSQRSLSHSTSVCIESALIPDLATLSPSSSDSDWDCDLLSRLGPTSAGPSLPTEQSCELDKELLHRPCNWMHDTSYESRLHTVLQPSTPVSSLCGEEMDPSAFSRTLVQIVEVQH